MTEIISSVMLQKDVDTMDTFQKQLHVHGILTELILFKMSHAYLLFLPFPLRPMKVWGSLNATSYFVLTFTIALHSPPLMICARSNL